MFCVKCGKELSDGAAFCPHCGAAVENTTPVTPAPVIAPLSPVAPAAAKNKSGGKIVLICLAVLLCIAVGGIGTYFFTNGKLPFIAAHSESDTTSYLNEAENSQSGTQPEAQEAGSTPPAIAAEPEEEQPPAPPRK